LQATKIRCFVVQKGNRTARTLRYPGQKKRCKQKPVKNIHFYKDSGIDARVNHPQTALQQAYEALAAQRWQKREMMNEKA
jgi:hypothetical protein